jgi:hypothetical protein
LQYQESLRIATTSRSLITNNLSCSLSQVCQDGDEEDYMRIHTSTNQSDQIDQTVTKAAAVVRQSQKLLQDCSSAQSRPAVAPAQSRPTVAQQHWRHFHPDPLLLWAAGCTVFCCSAALLIAALVSTLSSKWSRVLIVTNLLVNE